MSHSGWPIIVRRAGAVLYGVVRVHPMASNSVLAPVRAFWGCFSFFAPWVCLCVPCAINIPWGEGIVIEKQSLFRKAGNSPDPDCPIGTSWISMSLCHMMVPAHWSKDGIKLAGIIR